MRLDLSLRSELAAVLLGCLGALACFYGLSVSHAAAQRADVSGVCLALLGVHGAVALYFFIPCYATYVAYLTEESSDFHILFPVLAFVAGAMMGGSA